MSFTACTISRLSLSHFRPFHRTQDIRIAPITLVYGPNSAGKSALLRSLRWIKALNSEQSFSEFPSHVYKNDTNRKIAFELEFTATLEADPKEYFHTIGDYLRQLKTDAIQIRLFATIGQQPFPEVWELPILSRPSIESFTLHIDGEMFLTAELGFHTAFPVDPFGAFCTALFIRKLNTSHPLLKHILSASQEHAINAIKLIIDNIVDDPQSATDAPSAPFDTRLLRKLADSVGSFSIDEIPPAFLSTFPKLTPCQFPPLLQPTTSSSSIATWNVISGQSTLQKHATDPLTSILILFRHNLCHLLEWIANSDDGFPYFLEGLQPIGPTRTIPNTSFSNVTQTTTAPGWPPLSQRAATKANSWLARLNRSDTQFCFQFSSQPNPNNADEKVLLLEGIQDIQRGITLPFTDVGTGFSQIAPILISAFSQTSQVILVEQPELHLHPALQSELGDLFIETALGKDSCFDSKQYILETHSEHILLRIMRRIRETTHNSIAASLPAIRPSDVSVLYIDPRTDGSVVLEMPIDENGQLVRDWPGGFFEEGIREVLM